MFHLMLVLPFLIAAAAVLAVVLLGIFTVIVSIVGGSATALLVKNKLIKKLIFIGLCILSFIGMLFVIPAIALYAKLSALVLTLAFVSAFICIGILALVGFKASNAVQNRIAKTVLKVLFVFVAIGAVSAAIFVPTVRLLLLAV